MSSTWVNVRDSIEKMLPGALPVLGTALGGPAGGAVGALVASALGVAANPDDVSQALQKDPQAAVKLAQIASDERVKIAALASQERMQASQTEGTVIQAVQAGIASDAAGKGGWLQNNWHALASLWLFALATGVFFILPVWHGYKPEILLPVVDPLAWTAMGAVLGVKHWADSK